MEGSLADFGVDLAVVFHLDPGLGGVVELLQSEVSNALEHGKKPALYLAPKGLLLSILIRTERQRVFKKNAQASQTLFGLRRDHGRAVVPEDGPGELALLKTLAQTVAEFLGAFGQIPLGMAAKPGVVVEGPGGPPSPPGLLTLREQADKR